MIGIYVEGGKTLGLGHLSRASVVYYYLTKFYNVSLFIYGDIVGNAYLDNLGIKYVNCKDKDVEIEEHAFWIVDSTTISCKKVVEQLEGTKFVVLLSPKFVIKYSKYIDLALLRNDPFNLDIDNKIIDARFFVHNSLLNHNTGANLGIILSGADFGNVLSDTVELCLNNEEIADNLKSITVLLGSTSTINFERKRLSSYRIALKFVSVLGNVWEHLKDSDLVIVGNGIVVEEAIAEQKKCIVYVHSANNKILKLNKNLVSGVTIARNAVELKKSLIEELPNYSTKLPSLEMSQIKENLLLKKLKRVIEARRDEKFL